MRSSCRRPIVARDIGGPAARAPLWDVIREPPESKALRSLGFDAEVPPPLYQADAPGHPDFGRPALLLDPDTSAMLVEAVKRTFPVPAVDDSVEQHRPKPFRTAFIGSIPDSTHLPRPKKKGAHIRSSTNSPNKNQHTGNPASVDISNVSAITASAMEMTITGLPVTVVEPGDVLPYVAFGPYPRVVRPRAMTPGSAGRREMRPRPIGTTFEAEIALRMREESLRRQPTMTSSSPRAPLYVRQAEAWKRQEQVTFTVDLSNKTRIKKEQAMRVVKRNARLALEEQEHDARRQLTEDIRDTHAAMRADFRKKLDALFELEQQVAKKKELERLEMLRVMRLQQAAEHLAARQRAVRERAEWLVSVERDKVAREETATRSRMRQLEVEACARAKRREAARMERDGPTTRGRSTATGGTASTTTPRDGSAGRTTSPRAAISDDESRASGSDAPQPPRTTPAIGDERDSKSQSATTPASHQVEALLQPMSHVTAEFTSSSGAHNQTTDMNESAEALSPVTEGVKKHETLVMRDPPATQFAKLQWRFAEQSLRAPELEFGDTAIIDCVTWEHVKPLMQVRSEESLIPAHDTHGNGAVPIRLRLQMLLVNPADDSCCDKLSFDQRSSNSPSPTTVLRALAASDAELVLESQPIDQWDEIHVNDFVTDALRCTGVSLDVAASAAPRQLTLRLAVLDDSSCDEPTSLCESTVSFPLVAPLLRILRDASAAEVLSVQRNPQSADEDDRRLMHCTGEVPAKATPTVALLHGARLLVLRSGAIPLNHAVLVVSCVGAPLETLLLDPSALEPAMLAVVRSKEQSLDIVVASNPNVVVATVAPDVARRAGEHSDRWHITFCVPPLSDLPPVSARLLAGLRPAALIEAVVAALRCTVNVALMLPASTVSEMKFYVELNSTTKGIASMPRRSVVEHCVSVTSAEQAPVSLLRADEVPVPVRAGLHHVPIFHAIAPIARQAMFTSGTVLTASVIEIPSDVSGPSPLPEWRIVCDNGSTGDGSALNCDDDGFLKWCHSAAKLRVAEWRVTVTGLQITLIEDCPAGLIEALLRGIHVRFRDTAPDLVRVTPVRLNIKLSLTVSASAPSNIALPSSVTAMLSAAALITRGRRSGNKVVAPPPVPALPLWSQLFLAVPATERFVISTPADVVRPLVVLPAIVTVSPSEVQRPFTEAVGTAFFPASRLVVRPSSAEPLTKVGVTITAPSLISLKANIKAGAFESKGSIARFTVSLEDLPEALTSVIECVAQENGMGAIKIAISAEQPRYVDEFVFDVIAFKTSPFPAVEVPQKLLEYRQGSRLAATNSFQLFPGARAVLPAGFRALTCELTVELTAGGFGDGQDVLEFIRPDALTQDSGAEVVADKYGSLKVTDRVVGTWQELPNAAGLAVSFQLGDEVLVTDASVAAVAADVTAVMRAIGYRNSDPRLRLGARVFTLRIAFGRDEPYRTRTSVNAIPFVFSIPTFASRIHCTSGSAIPSACHKLAVNALDATVPAASVFVQLTSGWCAEDALTFAAQAHSDALEVIVEATSSEFVVYSPPGSDIPVAIGRLSSNKRGVNLEFPTRALTGRVLQQLLRAVGYANSGANLLAGPRTVEFLFEDPDSTTCWASLQIMVRVPELPAVIDLTPSVGDVTSRRAPTVVSQLAMTTDGRPLAVAPTVTVSMRSAASGESLFGAVDGRPTLRVEFLHQAMPSESVGLEPTAQLYNPPAGDDNQPPSLTLDGNRVTLQGTEVGIITVRRRDTFAVAFHQSCFSEAVVQHVMRHVAYRFGTADGTAASGTVRRLKSRGQVKKVQMSLSPNGHGLWSRATVAISSEEQQQDAA